MKSVLSLLLLALTIGACNPVLTVVKKVDRKYEKWGAEEIKINTGEAVMNVRVLGEGPETVLLIHGYGPLPQAQWYRQARQLRDDYRLIIPDLIYFGDSRSDSKEYSVDFQVEQVNAVLDTLNAGSVNVVGLSYGGMVAATFAHKYAEKVNKLVLVDALSQYYERDHVDSLVRANDIDYIGDLLLPDSPANLNKLYQFTFRKRRIPKFLARDILENLYQDQRSEKLEVLRYIDEQAEYLGQQNYQVPVPVLIVWGTDDRLIPVRNAVSLDHYYADSRIVFIPKSGHTPNIEQSKDFNRVIDAFLRE